MEEPIAGRDGSVRAVRLRAGKKHLERAVQQLYPLELSCDMLKDSDGVPRLLHQRFEIVNQFSDVVCETITG